MNRTVIIVLIIILVVIVAITVSCNRGHHWCRYRFATIRYQITGRIYNVDKVVDNSGVGVWVVNESTNERFQLYSDELLIHANVGDSIFKPANSEYGILYKNTGDTNYLHCFDNDEHCVGYSPEQIDEVLREDPVKFKR